MLPYERREAVQWKDFVAEQQPCWRFLSADSGLVLPVQVAARALGIQTRAVARGRRVTRCRIRGLGRWAAVLRARRVGAVSRGVWMGVRRVRQILGGVVVFRVLFVRALDVSAPRFESTG